MDAPREVRRFALYGEGNGPLAPEFVHIETISQRSRLFDWTISPHAHPGIFQILLLEAGSGVLAIDGAERGLRPGTLVALPSGCVHAFRFAPDAEGWVLSIAVDLLNDRRISALCGASGSAGGDPRWGDAGEGGAESAAAVARIGWLLADLAGVLAHDRAGLLPDAVAARIALILALVEEALAPHGTPAPPRRGGARAGLAARFREAVELHFRDGWSVQDYANALGVTAPTLTRACRAALGKAPGEAVLDRTLLEAMRSLTYSAATVSQIAGDLGFADTAYFARFFKARSGMTAGAFRRQRGWLANSAALPKPGNSA